MIRHIIVNIIFHSNNRKSDIRYLEKYVESQNKNGASEENTNLSN